MRFKEIEASFKVKKDTAFIKGDFYKDRSSFIFKIKRLRSNCFKYGDMSAHTLQILNSWGAYRQFFDTRYNGIPTAKKEWLDYWKRWLENEYELKIELIDFKSKYINIE